MTETRMRRAAQIAARNPEELLRLPGLVPAEVSRGLVLRLRGHREVSSPPQDPNEPEGDPVSHPETPPESP